MNRRGLLLGLLAAPVIIRTPGLLMPVRSLKLIPYFPGADFLIQRIAELDAALTRMIAADLASLTSDVPVHIWWDKAAGTVRAEPIPPERLYV